MNNYQVKKILASSPNWADIPLLSIETYPWYKTGAKQATRVQLAYNDIALFINIEAEDQYSYSKQTELNHMLICEDSCVEIFFSPSGVLGSSYINLEVNCCGTLHLAYGQDRHLRKFLPIELAALVQRTASIKSPVKLESTDDVSWEIEITLPFKVVAELTGESVNPEKWLANFYRCGGRQDPQYAVWNNIKVNQPDYHRPESFGLLNFK